MSKYDPDYGYCVQCYRLTEFCDCGRECETCDGTGRVTVKNEVVIGWCGKQTETATEQIVDECPECNGTGEAKC
jgi:DnaJ-class molecular chaperone